MNDRDHREFMGPQEIANDIVGSTEGQHRALGMVTGFQEGLACALSTWDAERIEERARQHRYGTTLEYRKGWAIGQAMGAVKKASEGRIKFKMS